MWALLTICVAWRMRCGEWASGTSCKRPTATSRLTTLYLSDVSVLPFFRAGLSGAPLQSGLVSKDTRPGEGGKSGTSRSPHLKRGCSNAFPGCEYWRGEVRGPYQVSACVHGLAIRIGE